MIRAVTTLHGNRRAQEYLVECDTMGCASRAPRMGGTKVMAAVRARDAGFRVVLDTDGLLVVTCPACQQTRGAA